MEGLHTQHTITSTDIRHFRQLFFHSQPYLQTLISSNNDDDNKLLLQLHFLMNQLQHFFDQPADQESLTGAKQGRLLMEVIHEGVEGNSEKDISSTTLKGDQPQSIPKIASKHSASFSSPKHCSKGSNDSLHQPQCMYTPPQQITSLEEALEKYQRAVITINALTNHKSKIEQKLTDMNDKLLYFEREKEGMIAQKKECLSLLVRHSERNEKLASQNNSILGVVKEYEERIEALEMELREKGDLLDEIQEYLREESEPEQHRITFKPSSFRNQSLNPVQLDKLQNENERLNIEISRLSEQIEIILQQNSSLKQQYHQIQSSMDSLLRDNEEFYNQVQQLKRQLKNQHNKNKQLIKIEEGKRLNDMVHKENKHLLQINYEIGNRIHELETEVESLNDYIMKMEYRDQTRDQNSLEKTYKSKLNMTSEETMMVNHTPKGKFSFKGTGDKFLQNVNASGGQTEDYDKSRLVERNRELEDKVGKLVYQLNVYQKELGEKQHHIQKLSVSLGNALGKTGNLHRVSEDQQSRNIATSKLSVEFENEQRQDQVNEGQFMSIEVFSQRFQPSPMDILFIMLRISELCQSMLQSGVSYSLSPTNVFLILDHPDHPQNIFVKIQKQESSRQSALFISPETAMRRASDPQQPAVVWNMGMLFYFLLYKTPYFQSMEELVDGDVILSKERFPEVEDIIQRMLERQSGDRVEIKDLLEMIAAEINKMLEEEQG